MFRSRSRPLLPGPGRFVPGTTSPVLTGAKIGLITDVIGYCARSTRNCLSIFRVEPTIFGRLPNVDPANTELDRLGGYVARAPYTPPPPPIQSKAFTPAEIDAGITKVRRRIDDLRKLEADRVPFDDARVAVVESDIRNTIRDVFGPSSPEFDEHQYHDVWKGPRIAGDHYEAAAKFADGIPQSVTILNGLVSRLEEKRAEISEAAVVGAPVRRSGSEAPSRRVFLVHGHDEAAKQAVARFLEQLRLSPVLLSERPNEGRTIIEKFEHNADVAYAVVLLTPDDRAVPDADGSETRPRARQNVILELGYFIGRLSRAHVCALYKGSVELPSDLHGVLYVPMVAQVRHRVAHFRLGHKDDLNRVVQLLRDVDAGFWRFCSSYNDPHPVLPQSADALVSHFLHLDLIPWAQVEPHRWARVGAADPREPLSCSIEVLDRPSAEQSAAVDGSPGRFYDVRVHARQGRTFDYGTYLETTASLHHHCAHVCLEESSRDLRVTLPCLLGSARVIPIVERLIEVARNCLRPGPAGGGRSGSVQELADSIPEFVLGPQNPLAYLGPDMPCSIFEA